MRCLPLHGDTRQLYYISRNVASTCLPPSFVWKLCHILLSILSLLYVQMFNQNLVFRAEWSRCLWTEYRLCHFRRCILEKNYLSKTRVHNDTIFQTVLILCSRIIYYTTKFHQFRGLFVADSELSMTLSVFKEFPGLQNVKQIRDFWVISRTGKNPVCRGHSFWGRVAKYY